MYSAGRGNFTGTVLSKTNIIQSQTLRKGGILCYTRF